MSHQSIDNLIVRNCILRFNYSIYFLSGATVREFCHGNFYREKHFFSWSQKEEEEKEDLHASTLQKEKQ